MIKFNNGKIFFRKNIEYALLPVCLVLSNVHGGAHEYLLIQVEIHTNIGHHFIKQKKLQMSPVANPGKQFGKNAISHDLHAFPNMVLFYSSCDLCLFIYHVPRALINRHQHTSYSCISDHWAFAPIQLVLSCSY